MKRLLVCVMAITHVLASVCLAQMTQQWVSRYNGPRGYDDYTSAMVVDASGNVIVTGYAIDSIAGSTPFMRYATVKYNSSGVQQWSAIYHEPADTSDRASCIGVDAAGNVYVSGLSWGTYTSSWVTIKYNSFGVQQWVQRWSGLISACLPYAMTVDAQGNLYITGRGNVIDNQSFDYVTIKYNTNGTQQWISTYTYNNLPNYEDVATAITIDNIGNIYVTGSSMSGTSFDIATIKYNSFGAVQWVQRHTGGALYLGGVYTILNDNLGNVFVGAVGVTLKYNSSGVLQWEKAAGGGYSTSMALDRLGNSYVANLDINTYNCTIIKYNTSGDSLWGRRFFSPSAPRVAFENCLGYVYVSSSIYTTSIDYLTVRYNSYGDSLWSGIYHGPGNGGATANTVDGLGNVYVTGNSYGTGTYLDYATIKYTPASFFIHTAKRNNLNKAINDNQATSDSVFIDCSLMNYTTVDVNVKLDTLLHTRDSDLEIYLIHNTPTDNITTIDTLVYQAGGTGQNFIRTILNDSATTPVSSGAAPFTGSFKPHRPLSQFNGQLVNGTWILKIFDRATGNTGVLKAWSMDFAVNVSPTSVPAEPDASPPYFVMKQNYPNPFNPTTTIHFSVGTYGHTSLRVFNLLGQEVATLVNEQKQPGSYSVQFDGRNLASGVYYYKLQAGNFSSTQKMLLVR